MGQQAQPGSKSQPSRKKSFRNAIQLLTADHQKVSKIFDQYKKLKDKGSNEDKHALVKQACNELTLHAQIEEEIFYPAMREMQGAEDLLDEAKVEHASIKTLVTELEFMNPGSDLYDAKFTVLSEYVTHHVKEEEKQMFAKAKKNGLDLNRIGEELEHRKQELATQYGFVMEDQEESRSGSAKDSRSTSSAQKSAP